MKILVTGSNGFIGRNLISELYNRGYTEIMEYDLGCSDDQLNSFCEDAEFIFHLAGVNRPETNEEYMEGNFGFSSTLLDKLKACNNNCPILISSSIQAELNNPYGKSKKAGEDLFFHYGKITDAKVYVFRLPNVFGKWCRPNYNSVIATFCNNIAYGQDITVNDPSVFMTLVYIDDVVDAFIRTIQDDVIYTGVFCEIHDKYEEKLGNIASLLYSFKKNRIDLNVPNLDDPFTKKLYSTYLSYMPQSEFSYPLKMNTDSRGSFTEFIRTKDRGQVSINISKPGIIKGNHWHHTKNEKFLVVSGQGIIRFRNINSDEIIEYHVSGEILEVLDIPTGYTHNIENIGNTDLVTVMWVNELFNPEKPDTFFLEV